MALGARAGAGAAYNQAPAYAQDPDAQALAQQTLQGQFLQEENPYMQQVIDRSNRDVNEALGQQMGQLTANSLRPGLLGSSVWENQRQALNDDATKRIADSTFNTRFQGYEAERGRQNEVLGMMNARDAQIWGDLTARAGQDKQAEAARAGAMANAAAQRQQALAREAEIRSNLILGQGRLAEEARQFDAQMPLQWGGLLGQQLNAYGQQQQGDLAGLTNLISQQMGSQQGAAALAQQLGLGAQGQQLQAAGMMPDFQQAGLAPMAMAGDYLSGLYNTQAGLQSAQMSADAQRATARMGLQQSQDALRYQSAMTQWGYNNPQSALQDYLGTAMGFAPMVGEISNQGGVGGPAGGAVVPRDDSGMDLLQAGLAIWAASGGY